MATPTPGEQVREFGLVEIRAELARVEANQAEVVRKHAEIEKIVKHAEANFLSMRDQRDDAQAELARLQGRYAEVTGLLARYKELAEARDDGIDALRARLTRVRGVIRDAVALLDRFPMQVALVMRQEQMVALRREGKDGNAQT